MKPVCFTIAGADPLLGAGTFLDLQVFKAHSVRAAAIVSVVTAQNSTRVFSTHPVSNQLFSDQLDALVEVMTPTAIKLGLLFKDHAKILRRKLKELNNDRLSISIVCDPVLKSSSGTHFMHPGDIEEIFPYCSLVTPNLHEAEVLSGLKIVNIDDVYEAGSILLQKYKTTSFLIKGGHLQKGSSDYLFTDKGTLELQTKFVKSDYSVRGTGCLLSSAIAANLANNLQLTEAVTKGKKYLEQQLLDIEVEDDGKFALFSFQK